MPLLSKPEIRSTTGFLRESDLLPIAVFGKKESSKHSSICFVFSVSDSDRLPAWVWHRSVLRMTMNEFEPLESTAQFQGLLYYRAVGLFYYQQTKLRNNLWYQHIIVAMENITSSVWVSDYLQSKEHGSFTLQLMHNDCQPAPTLFPHGVSTLIAVLVISAVCSPHWYSLLRINFQATRPHHFEGLFWCNIMDYS